MKLLSLWITNALVFFVVANVVPGISIRGFETAFWIALLWGVIGVTLRPILLLLALPITLLTLGLFTFVVNGFLLWLLSKLVDGFHVESFGAALFGALLLSFFNWALNHAVRKREDS